MMSMGRKPWNSSKSRMWNYRIPFSSDEITKSRQITNLGSFHPGLSWSVNVQTNSLQLIIGCSSFVLSKLTKLFKILRPATSRFFAMASTIKPIVTEASTKHTATIIFLHGLGDTGLGWSDELQTLKPSYAKLICPTAPTAPVTINNGFKMPSWFDIRSLDKNNKNQDEEGVKESSAAIIEMIQSEINGVDGKPGIPASRIVIGGFSQGGALSLYTGLTAPFTVGGIVSLSGYLPIASTISWETIQKPKILQCHGDADSVVPIAFGVQTSQALKKYLPESSFKFRVYQGMDHCSSAEELSDFDDFLKEIIPPI